MDSVSTGELEVGVGLVGSADRGGNRQVTVIAEESWKGMMEELGVSLSPASRRANLLVSGVDLRETRGRILRVGAAVVELRGETRPCERMDEAFQGLRAAMGSEWRGGVYGVVVQGGRITVGDEVTLSDE